MIINRTGIQFGGDDITMISAIDGRCGVLSFFNHNGSTEYPSFEGLNTECAVSFAFLNETDIDELMNELLKLKYKMQQTAVNKYNQKQGERDYEQYKKHGV